MRLNAQTDFSLRMLMYLAVKSGGPATIQEVSTRMGLSQTHMMRVAAKLAAKGLVVSSRGRQGGVSLAREASEITVEEVVKAMEPDFALVQCFDDSKSECTIEPACNLKHVLTDALEAFFAAMRAVTLAQLTESNHAQLVRLLDLEEYAVAKGGLRLSQSPVGGA